LLSSEKKVLGLSMTRRFAHVSMGTDHQDCLWVGFPQFPQDGIPSFIPVATILATHFIVCKGLNDTCASDL